MSQLAPAVSSDLKQLASDVLTKALKAGATDAEAVIYEGDEFSALVHLGQVETLKESGSRAVGLRVSDGLHCSHWAQPSASRRSDSIGPRSAINRAGNDCMRLHTFPSARSGPGALFSEDGSAVMKATSW